MTDIFRIQRFGRDYVLGTLNKNTSVLKQNNDKFVNVEPKEKGIPFHFSNPAKSFRLLFKIHEPIVPRSDLSETDAMQKVIMHKPA
jgi:hypothetical protein